MIKRAYSKALRLLLPPGIVSILIPVCVSVFINMSNFEPSPAFLFTFVGFAILVLAAFVSMSVITLVKIAVFSRALSKVDFLELQTAENDFAKNDRFGDLYFTGAGVVVHQLRRGVKTQLRYIPYKSIIGVVSLPAKPIVGSRMEVLTYAPCKNCRFNSPVHITLENITYINEKIGNMRSGFKTAGGSAGAYTENSRLLSIIKNSPLVPVVGTFLVLALYLLGMLGIIELPGLILTYSSPESNAEGHSLFWPGLIYMLWTAAAIAMEVILLLRSLFKMPDQESPLGTRTFIGAMSFSVLSCGFILFIAVLYGMDQHVVRDMARGLILLLNL